MKNYCLVLIILFILTANIPLPCFAGQIEKDRERWKTFYIDVVPAIEVTHWKVPFKTKDRNDLKTIQMISIFGAARQSYVKGHFHTGVDLIPRKNQGKWVYVYPMAEGTVCSIHLGDPHRTVVVKHKLPNGEFLYTSYKHLREIYLHNGQPVAPDTRVGRLYTAAEARTLGGNYHHLHLEIRKKFDDYGVASWATLTKEDLGKRFHDPWQFMKKNVKTY